MGFGVVEESAGKLKALDCGTLVTSASLSAGERLKTIFGELGAVIGRWEPEAMAIERVWFKLNAKTAVGTIEASGVAMLAAALGDLPVFEYSPLEMKQAVVGTGSATKEQVLYMLERMLTGLGSMEGGSFGAKGADAADALGVAVCHLNSRKLRDIGVAR
jgi:crossover junction endodeoxyribonuclease RuvC